MEFILNKKTTKIKRNEKNNDDNIIEKFTLKEIINQHKLYLF